MMRTSGRPFDGSSRLWALFAALTAAGAIPGCGGDDIKCGGPFCVSPGPPEATTLKVFAGGGQTGKPGRQLDQPIIVMVTDDDERPIADVAVSFSVSQGGGSVSAATIQSDIEGKAEVSWTLGPDVGTQSIQAAANATSGDPLSGSPLVVSAQAVRPPPVRVVLRTSPPETAQNGVRFERQPVVEVLDADGDPVPQVLVTASISTGGGTLSGITGVASDPTGQAVYTDLAILGSTGARILRFSVADPALEVASGPVELQPGGAAELTGIQPLVYEGTVTSPVSPPPSVVVKDASGNPVPGVAVTFTPDRDASVSPLSVTTNQDGMAQVTSWTLGTTANVPYSLEARIAGPALPPVVFSAIARPGAAGRLQIVTQPSASAQNGAPLAVQPVIQVTDQNGNPTPEPGVTVTASVTSGSGTLDNATARTDGTGRASFSGLTITGRVDNYIISFSAPRLTGVNSSTVSLAAGPAAKLAVATEPPTARSRAPLSPQPSIQVQDASGNAVRQAGIQITATSSGNATLSGQGSVATDVNGLAAFTDLTFTGAPGSQLLTFGSTSPALVGVSIPVTLPAVATIEVQPPAPPSAPVGSTITITWVLKDAAGQPVSDVPVTLSGTAGTLAPSGSATSDGNGVVQVQWTLATAAGDQSAMLTVTGTDLANTIHVEATPGSAVTLQKISGDNQEAPPNSALPENFVVRLLDLYGNGVGGVTVDWRDCDGNGDYSPVTGPDGYSSAHLDTGPTPGTYCARASAAGLSVDFTYTVTAPAMSPSLLNGNQRSQGRPIGPAPVAPRPSVVRPQSR